MADQIPAQSTSQFAPEIDRLWDALTRRGMHYDRGAMERDEPALVDRHRASLGLALAEGGWMPRSEAVPCDDAAIERAAREMASWSGPVPSGVDGFRPFAERVLRAAGETLRWEDYVDEHGYA